MKTPFQLSIHPGRYATYAAFLRRYLLAAKERIRAPLNQFSIVLVGNRKMSDLHQQFMNLPDPTDVLTFPIDLDRRGRPISGEVFICVPYAEKTAKSRGIEPQNELLLYALHGMLHLCGFDDRTDRGFAQMHRKEDRILQQLGVGAVFAPRVFPPIKLSPVKLSTIRRPRERAGKRNH